MAKVLTIPDNWNASQMPDLTGKRFLITGATSGIGLAAATELARRNANVVITARSVEKARDAIKKIGPGLVDYILMDLTDLESVKRAAAVACALIKSLEIIRSGRKAANTFAASDT